MDQTTRLGRIRDQAARIVGRLDDVELQRLAAVRPVFFYLVESLATGRLAGGRGVTDRFLRRLTKDTYAVLLRAAAGLFRESASGVWPLDTEPELCCVAIYLWIEETGLSDINEAMSDERLHELAAWFSNLILTSPWLN